ncbi:MAG: hypothetical protein AAGK97_09200, partial [Bacteroidota bacterium]
MKIENIGKHIIPYAIIALGIFFRLYLFIQNRSLMIDEANLARNIVEKSGLEFFKVLDYQQYAPPLFLQIQKYFITLFGV